MIYADETFYGEKYLLGRKPVIREGFAFYARTASRLIDQYTFGRLEGADDIPESVRMCCCDLAEVLYNTEKQEQKSGGLTSEKVGTWSVTYDDASKQREEERIRAAGIICRWLGNTGLCYQGV